jgi:hypothetical protein
MLFSKKAVSFQLSAFSHSISKKLSAVSSQPFDLFWLKAES